MIPSLTSWWANHLYLREAYRVRGRRISSRRVKARRQPWAERAGRLPSPLMDVLFHGATVYDGSGAEGVRQDVAVRAGRIVAVGSAAQHEGAATVIDADGLALAPGFIDMHSHADHTVPANPTAPNSITPGVTTEQS